jgi:predicted double-glycine peptidase
LVQVNRVQPTGPVKAPGRVEKRTHQDTPKPGVTYGQVYRSEGDPEETIKAILYFAQQKVLEKRGGKEGQGKKKQGQKQPKKPPYDEDKTYMIASPVEETLVQPRQNGCAPTCLAMLLRKYGQVKTVREGYERVEALRTAGAEHINDVGLSLEDIATYAQQAGLKARVQRGYSFLSQLEGLLRVLNRGATPIASVQLPGMGNMRHAVLIVGITQHLVTIVDPARAEIQQLPIADFQIEWQKEDKTQAGVGLAYVEVWGENARGEIIQETVSWGSIIEEITRDRLFFSEIATARRDSRFAPAVIQFFDD